MQGSVSVQSVDHMNGIKFVSKYLSHTDIPLHSSTALRESALLQWAQEYQDPHSPPHVQARALEGIIYNTFFLYAHVLKNRGFAADQFDDGLQNMTICVIEALPNFDLSRSTKLTSYLACYFREAVDRTVRESSVVRVPKQVRRQNAQRLRKMRSEGLFPSEPEIRDPELESFQGETTTEIDEELRHSQTGSTDAPEVPNDLAIIGPSGAQRHPGVFGDINALPQVADFDVEKIVAHRQLVHFLEKAMTTDAAGLNEREKKVIAHRWGIFGAPKHTLQEISEQFKVFGWRGTKEWVHQLQLRATKKLHAYFVAEGVISA